MSHLATLLSSLLPYEVRLVLYWFEAALICLLILAALAGCIICIWYFIEFILDGEKKGALFLGTLALVLGFFCVLFISKFPKAPKNPNTINPQAVEALKKHHTTSYDDDHGSSTKSSSSSSSSGSSSGGSVWNQPQPQSWGGGYSQQSSPSNERPLKMVRVWHECGYCNGTGREARTTYCPGAEGKKYCPECGGTFWAFEGHYHTRCSSCNGQKGYYTESWE